MRYCSKEGVATEAEAKSSFPILVIQDANRVVHEWVMQWKVEKNRVQDGFRPDKSLSEAENKVQSCWSARIRGVYGFRMCPNTNQAATGKDFEMTVTSESYWIPNQYFWAGFTLAFVLAMFPIVIASYWCCKGASPAYEETNEENLDDY